MSDPRRRTAEWAAFAVAGATVLAVLGLTVWLQLRGGDAPPSFSVETTEIRRVDDGFSVHVRVTNRGARTASSVQVLGELTVDGTTLESEQLVDFLAGGGSRRLVFRFPVDPARGELTLRVASYSLP